MEHTDKKSAVLKFAGLLGIAVPVLVAIVSASFQYRQFVLESRDNNFRQVVEKLASGKSEERQASATNLGVYLRDPAFKEQTLDILVNMTAIELDTNVLSAIRSSIDKLNSPQDKKHVMQKLLLLGNSSFAWSAAMKAWRELATSELDNSYKQFLGDLASFKEAHEIPAEKLPIKLFAKVNNLEEKSRVRSQAARQYSEIAIHEEIIAGFIKSMLNNTTENPIENLEFFQNSLNYQAILNTKLIDPKIINSAFSRAMFDSLDVVGVSDCTIHNTTFQYSNVLNSTFENCDIRQTLFTGNATDKVSLFNTSFSGSKFKDVFFYRADLHSVDFSQVEGLKAEYFYGALNYKLANFSDKNFINEIDAINKKPDDFVAFLISSSLTGQRFSAICKDLVDTENVSCNN